MSSRIGAGPLWCADSRESNLRGDHLVRSPDLLFYLRPEGSRLDGRSHHHKFLLDNSAEPSDGMRMQQPCAPREKDQRRRGGSSRVLLLH